MAPTNNTSPYSNTICIITHMHMTLHFYIDEQTNLQIIHTFRHTYTIIHPQSMQDIPFEYWNCVWICYQSSCHIPYFRHMFNFRPIIPVYSIMIFTCTVHRIKHLKVRFRSYCQFPELTQFVAVISNSMFAVLWSVLYYISLHYVRLLTWSKSISWLSRCVISGPACCPYK